MYEYVIMTREEKINFEKKYDILSIQTEYIFDKNTGILFFEKSTYNGGPIEYLEFVLIVCGKKVEFRTSMLMGMSYYGFPNRYIAFLQKIDLGQIPISEVMFEVQNAFNRYQYLSNRKTGEVLLVVSSEFYEAADN